MSINTIFDNLGLSQFATSKGAGIRKKSIYKTELFTDCDTKQSKMDTRKQLRKMLDRFFEAAKLYVKNVNAPKKSEIPAEFAKQFATFYTNVYATQNWETNSLYDVSKTEHSNGWHKVMQTLLDAAKDTVTTK